MFLLIFLVATGLAIFLDIPILRQLLGLIFLTTIPGLLILYMLNVNKLGLTEKIVLSIGLSTAFLILFGLLINWVYPLLGYATPLSTMSLSISFSVILLILGIIGYKRTREVFSLHWCDFRLNTKEKAFLVLPALFPLLSILGVDLMNTTDNNAMLMTLLFLIPAYVTLIALIQHRLPERIYPVIIYLISISLLLMPVLRSSYIIGFDIHREYYFFQLTASNQYWQIIEGRLEEASLVVSLLPTIYQSFLNIDPQYLFVILRSFLFAIAPLVVYIISKKYIGNFWSFLTAFFFISQVRFLAAGGGIRTEIAILFFALAVMVLFHERISEFNKKLLVIIFATSCILSHYTTTYIFFFLLLLTWLGIKILPSFVSGRRRPLATSGNPATDSNPRNPSLVSQDSIPVGKGNAGGISRSYVKQGTTLIFVILFFTMLFFWYGQVMSRPFDSAVHFVYTTFISLNQFFVAELRGGEAASLLGLDMQARETPWKIEFVLSWLIIALIAIGVLATVGRYKRMVAIPNWGNALPPGFMARKFDLEYFVLVLAGCAMLVFAIVLPFVLYGFSATRLFLQMMSILSPFFIIGGIIVARWLRTRSYWVILAILIPYFMCTSGTIYQVFNYPESIVLNSEGPRFDHLYVHAQESFAAKWLGDNAVLGRAYTERIYASDISRERLISQGKISPRFIRSFSFLGPERRLPGGYVFLRYFNVVDGKVARGFTHDYDLIVELQWKFAGKGRIYSNGGSEVWK